MAEERSSVRTYLAISEELDPANIATLADLELSVSLASTLVEWDGARQVSGALADRWEIPSSKEIRFHLRKGLRWSDGDGITSSQFKRSLERAKREYGKALRSLFDVVNQIESPDESTLAFKLTVPVAESGILKKLTEPMYGLVSSNADGRIDFKRSSGPFVRAASTKNEIHLKANTHWWAYTNSLPDDVIVRQTPAKNLNGHFENDAWANLFMSTSLLGADRLSALKRAGFSIWERSYDKLFFCGAVQTFFGGSGA